MNTDGIKVFRSSNYGLWPVYLAINELPFRMRTRRENMVFAGLWFGEYKPKMRIFLPPLAKSIKALADGFQVRPPDTTPFECKAFLLACSCDLQAKALVMDMVAHNGYYGCPKCLQKGTHNDRRHQYPCGAEGAQDPLRTHEETLAHAREAHIQQTTVYGIKGPSWLNLAPRFNLISGMTIDYMHGSLLGITKALMSLWFKSAKTQRYYCGHHLQEIDEMMLAMRPPLDIHRTPRAIQDHMQHWKASEYRAWLLFYSLPIMQHFLPPDYYENYTLLVTGLHILLKDTITEAELQSADDHLKQFVNGFEKLYGTSRVSLNVHSLLHYADTVRELGPLWAHSCFFFEDVNGQVLRLIHGTQAVEEQVLRAVAILQRFAEMGDQCFEPGTPAKKLWDKLNSVVQSPEERSNFEQIARGYYMVGSLKEELRRANGTYGSLKKCHVDVVLANVEFVPERFMVYQRLMKEGEMIHSRLYTRAVRHNSYTIAFVSNGITCFGEVLYFLQASVRTCSCSATANCQCDLVESRHYAIVQCFQPVGPAQGDLENSHPLYSVPHIFKCRKTEACAAVKLSNISGKVVSMYIKGNSYVATFPNRVEKD
ncbi:uncharacterized protein LOC118425770 [Branchiostoma floridae]|uniref:Uncharacterized protein LOC118425770 n=1 Tax=Branchiostoma floridae TaxID=7739 RepID=A0A9J7LZX3_BRAFL|nr:uncharacterized protein LOC118425770 [Branchiostoma floridae]